MAALESRLPKGSYTLTTAAFAALTPDKPVLHIKSYEQLPFDAIVTHSESTLANAYIIRKALIRKHYLSTTTYNWTTKHPSSVLAAHTKPSCDFELDYAEFLDDALIEAWELQASFRKNEGLDPAQREWWILKPGMSDRGQGIRLFSTEAELRSIFEEWEAEQPDSDNDEDVNEKEDGNEKSTANASTASSQKAPDADYIMTSHLRHFIAQPYIQPPLLLPSNPHKFHIRTYVIASGSLKIYVYRRMLALFAASPYAAPWTSTAADLSAHLTNTCLQTKDDSTVPGRPGTVQEFWSLPDKLASLTSVGDWRGRVFGQICDVTGEVFEAAARGMMVHFQPLPNAFEVFGLDFLVDASGDAWLLEVNAFPDFGQTGEELKGVVAGLWEGVVDVAVAPFFGVREQGKRAGGNNGEAVDMMLVREVDLGRR